MNHSNMYAVGLALCTFANISSEEMARDLANEIEKLLGSSNTYIRKKAALCALRVVKKVPDLMDHFVGKAKNLLTDRNHGNLLAATTLITEMCQNDESCLSEFRNVSLHLVSDSATNPFAGCSSPGSTLEEPCHNRIQHLHGQVIINILQRQLIDAR